MKTAGLLGGMAWPSTLEYYTLLNREIEKKAGNQHSAKCIIYSFDFDKINPSYRPPEEIVTQLRAGLKILTANPVDVLLICSNTMHKYTNELKTDLEQIFFLDIRECIGKELVKMNSNECLLLGTRYTMQNTFYHSYLCKHFGAIVSVPPPHHQKVINEIIFKELIHKNITNTALEVFTVITEHYSGNTIVLACTELRLVFNKIRTTKKVIDSTEAHVVHAAGYLLNS